MKISDFRLHKNNLGKIIPATAAQGPGTKPEQPRHPPEYPAPIEIPNPTEIPSPVPGDAPTEFPGPDENPTPEIEPPKEELIAGFSLRSQKTPKTESGTSGLFIRVNHTRARRIFLIRPISSVRLS